MDGAKTIKIVIGKRLSECGRSDEERRLSPASIRDFWQRCSRTRA